MTAAKKAGKNRPMGILSSDPRQQAILESAWKAFSAYGFRKTSMDDIARGAGISRPALYLHYRNKEDIFRTLAQYLYEASEQAVRDVLARFGDHPGHVFNLGHGVTPQVDPEHVAALVDAVHEFSAR